jgi:methionyl-tRNA synthetase
MAKLHQAAPPDPPMRGGEGLRPSIPGGPADDASPPLMGGSGRGAAFPSMKEPIQYDDFARLDIRTGTVTAAERMPKSQKLLKLRVDLGFEERTILSGIAEHFEPEQVEGRQVVVLANLAPRKMMGIESQGMILMAEDGDGKLCFVSPTELWPNGFGVK